MGAKTNFQIKWSQKALFDFISILNYIEIDSPINAKRVKTRINNIIKKIPFNTKMFREDELKENNDGSFRVFNKDNIRVSYKIEPKEILIIRIMHSKQEPELY